MREVIEEFLVESHENLDRIDREFVVLEQNPDDREVLAGVFRTVHTIKGTAGFLGLAKLEGLTHLGESLLSRLRDGELRLDRERTDALLAMVDAVRAMLAAVEEHGTDGDHDYAEVAAALERSATDDPAPDAPAPAGTLEFFGPVPAPSGANVADASIRVDVALLDGLVDLVGELVLARNQLVQQSGARDDPSLGAASRQLDAITTELQEGIMRTRLQPIGNAWAKLPRAVRDIAAQSAKQVRLETAGEDTELDRTVLEAIKDPLTHIVRNSVDHGIEAPDARRAAGKNPEGVLSLRAFHEGGLVNIEIEDDGNGIDPERVRAKAIDRGLVTPERAAAMTDAEAVELVFRPGFSTAQRVSNISGRGVGMDVVRTNIERIGGTVELESRLGHGATVRIKIPLTLAIIPVLMVRAGGERFAIPQVSLLELVRLEGERATTDIEHVQDAAVYRLRGRLLPIVSLAEELGVEPISRSDVVNVAVLEADGREFGLVVDEIDDTAEIVVKPLGHHAEAVGVFAGATIMGDGRVALIVDVAAMARRRGVVADRGAEAMREAAATDGRHLAAADRTSVLVVDTGCGRAAIALDSVLRIEEIQPEQVEHTGGRSVVQYRDRIMALVDLAAFIAPGRGPERTGGPQHVVVVTVEDQPVGVVVGTVADIVDGALETEVVGRRVGVIGTAVVDGVVTDVVDLDAVVARARAATASGGRP